VSNLNVPNALSIVRIALAPCLVVLAWFGESTAFTIGYALCLATDIADGQIARRFGLTTELGAKLDSWGDVLTYLAVLPGLFWLHPRFVSESGLVLGGVISSYLIPIGAGFLKYRRLTSYHTRLATVSAYALGGSLLVIFAGGPATVFYVAAAIILISQIEELAITAVLPTWQANVPSLRHALGRRGIAS
jgi:CDP-diacylglycerol---glycerol-3-phosphate 3-phosphatidyltransferase